RGEAGEACDLVPVRIELEADLVGIVEALAQPARDVARALHVVIEAEVDAPLVEPGAQPAPVAEEMLRALRWRRGGHRLDAGLAGGPGGGLLLRNRRDGAERECHPQGGPGGCTGLESRFCHDVLLASGRSVRCRIEGAVSFWRSSDLDDLDAHPAHA